MSESDKISIAAFDAWQRAHNAQFYLLIAYRHGDKDNAKRAIDHLATAASALKAALAGQPEAIEPAPIRVKA